MTETLFDEPGQADDVPKVTERTMLDALHRRYSAVSPGNGPRYVVAEHVRSAAGFYARRTCDFIALDTWPSSRFELIGHEVKISRSDWLRELKEPSKAAEFTRWLNRWYVVVPEARIVRPEELPDGWGLMVLTRNRLIRTRLARRNEPPPVPMTRLAAFARAVQKTARQRDD